MRLPQRPPSLGSDDLVGGLKLLAREDVLTLVRKANSEYYHWDELRARPMPTGITAPTVWAIVKFMRATGRRAVPLRGQDKQPYSYWLPPHAVETLHYVDRVGGGTLIVDGPSIDKLGPMRDQVVISSLMEEAIATSQIEGAATTRKVAKEMLREKRPPRTPGEKMIMNSFNTIEMVRKNKDRQLSMDFIFEIQASMTRDTLDDPTAAGRLRTAADEVVVADVRDGSVLYTPPKAEQLPARMQRLIDYANAPVVSDSFEHPLVKAAILHFWLAYEHPFVDGNGRTARALLYWFMLKNGYWLFEFLTLSRAIVKSPSRYYKSFLYSEDDENDLTYSLLYQIDRTRVALEDLHEYLRKKQDEQRKISSFLRSVPELNFRQQSIVDRALTHPDEVFTFQGHQRTHGITYVTARADILQLVRRGLLDDVGEGRPRKFIPAVDLAERLAQPAPRHQKTARAR